MFHNTHSEAFRSLPVNLQKKDVDLFKRSARYTMATPALVVFKRVFILWQGQLFKNGKIIPESLCTPLFVNKYPGRFFLTCLSKSMVKSNFLRLTKSSFLIIHDEWSDNYFHWLTEVVTRLYMLKDQLSNYTLIMPAEYKHSYQQYSLQKFAIQKIQWTHSRKVLFADEVVIPTRPAPVDNPGLLKNAIAFLVKDRSLGISKGEKIYISRQHAANRKVINEAEVIAFLQQQGFAILLCEELSFEEQMSIFAQARILISIHGAGLTNLVFMPADSCILELRKQDDSEKYNCYFTLSAVFGHRYFYQACTSNTDLPPDNADIYVDIDKLRANVALMPT